MIAVLTANPVCETRTKALIQDLVRRAVARMLDRQESDAPEIDSAGHLAQLAHEKEQIIAAQRDRNWELSAQLAASVAPQNGLSSEDITQPAVARQVLAVMRQLLELEDRVESHFDDPLHAGRELLQHHGIAPSRDALTAPLLLSEAIEKACEEATDEVEKKIRVVGKVALAYFGDISVASLTLEKSFELLHLLWMLPKGWGKSHGRNRYEKTGNVFDPVGETQQADAIDRDLIAAALADETMSVPDKRRKLVNELTPRLTDNYLVVQRDMFQRIVKAALGARRVGRDIDDEDRIVPSHRQLKSRLTKWHKAQRTPCGLPTRVSRPKRRRSWSLENIARLMISPIYAGTSSPKQRWRKASASRRLILRDSVYWVPLFMICMGLRPEEILQLGVKDVVRRDGLICLMIGEESDAVLKSEQSRRILPVPQLLLDLGFREWIVEKIDQKEIWAFPEVQPDSSHKRRSQIFGDRLRSVLKKLNLDSEHEDIYAMRRTLSSKLLQARIETGTRQRILGHLEGTTVDRHYSDHGLSELKTTLDSVDYGIQVREKNRFGFPVITGCSTPLMASLDVEIALSNSGELVAVRLRDPDTDETVLEGCVGGRPAPKGAEWANLPEFAAKDLAERIYVLSQQRALTLPTSEEAATALEHLLVLVSDQPMAAMISMEQETPTRLLPETSAAAKTVTKVDARTSAPHQFHRGDLIACRLPALPAAKTPAPPTPGLVVNVRILGSRKLLDIACGDIVDSRPNEPHELVLDHSAFNAESGINGPLRFNLRKRIQIEEIDGSIVHAPTAQISEAAIRALQETLQAAGDIAPVPVGERR